MELVSGTYALIIDLRHNHGGSPEGVVFWCSYLLPGGRIHLNDIFHADTGETTPFWSLAPIDPEQSTQQMITPCPASTSPRCSSTNSRCSAYRAANTALISGTPNDPSSPAAS